MILLMKPLTPQQIAKLQNMLAAAQQAQRSGLVAQAEALFCDILKQAPTAWDVQHQLAILFAATGRPQEAVKHFRLIAKANPAHAQSHANLANALSESGQFDEAIAEFKRAITLDNTLLGARIALGETLRRADMHTEAIDSFKSTLNLDKTNHAAFNGLGLVYRDLDDLPRALECFEYAVGLARNNAEYRAYFGTALRRYKLDGLAIEQFYEAIKLKPDWVDVIVLLAEVLHEQRRLDDAKECYDRTLQLMPDNPELIERRGYVYLDMGDVENALHEFQRVLKHHPERFEALVGEGRSHMEAGRYEDATKIFKKLIAFFPGTYDGYYNLALTQKFQISDSFVSELKAITEKSSDEDIVVSSRLNFALGKVYDDCQQWDTAFKHYAHANYLRNSKLKYKPSDVIAYYDALISTFNSEFIESHRNLGTECETPVLIVGMPRSGTTLTEQIISSHPQVIGAGEVLFWAHASESVPYTLGTERPYPECMNLMGSIKSLEIAEAYTNLLQKIAGANSVPLRITDKFPHNFLNLGLIALLFPKARIIHCKRNAMDNCLSIFFQNFLDGHLYAFDQINIGHHYTQYQRLMSHWHEVLPGRIFDINYEDTISDPEYWSRKLIDYVGLEWNDACLSPHKLERVVKTASQWQVRQPIYKTSVQRWQNYEKHLGLLKKALGYEDK